MAMTGTFEVHVYRRNDWKTAEIGSHLISISLFPAVLIPGS
jgi:hypothetical protein